MPLSAKGPMPTERGRLQEQLTVCEVDGLMVVIFQAVAIRFSHVRPDVPC